ncbi:N-6 DNA methylase [Saliphagus sp. LR7]|uniref:N-6 DNA methylase n=1 Tax=Saliphagus sp. LR7 TaxID=2282654 RepID=UPI00130046D8|nr:N-6 DNA methylase [Saliphagus sp. LR7]
MSSITTLDIDPVLEPLRTIEAQGFSRHTVFRDWVRLMLAALQRDDDQYLEILDTYGRGEHVAAHFSEAFGELLAAMADSNQDVLGMAYEEFGMQSDAFGQHFTPHTVAAGLAEMQTTDNDPDPPVTIADPACGSGRLLILAARTHDVQTICFGQDKDSLCARIAALNFCFFNLDGVVACGDSLQMKKRRAWEIQSTICGGEIREVDPDTVPWPETALHAETDAAQATEATDGAPSEIDGPSSEASSNRLAVEQGDEAATQADLDAWLDSSTD